jgi:hypothetical protein
LPTPHWLTRCNDAKLLAQLGGELPASVLWSVLLGVMEQRAQRTTSALLRQWREDRFVVPASVDQRTMLAVDAELLAAAADFEAVELSPLAPLGVCSTMALTGQNRVVASLRGTEVVADPTNVLALESAARLRREPRAIIKLATCHRCVRAQPVPKLPGFSAHFRIFCLTTAGKQTADQSLLVEAIVQQIRVHLAALARLAQIGYGFEEPRVKLMSSAARATVAQRIGAALSDIHLVQEPLTREYYDGLRFMIEVRSPQGVALPLIDGGVFNWLERLAANRKQVFVASGMGSQLLPVLFRI